MASRTRLADPIRQHSKIYLRLSGVIQDPPASQIETFKNTRFLSPNRRFAILSRRASFGVTDVRDLSRGSKFGVFDVNVNEIEHFLKAFENGYPVGRLPLIFDPNIGFSFRNPLESSFKSVSAIDVKYLDRRFGLRAIFIFSAGKNFQLHRGIHPPENLV